MNSRQRRSGFTAVEIMIVAGIMGMAFAMLVQFWQARSTTDAGITNRLTLQIEARKAADILTSQIREASEIVRPTLGETSPYVVFLDAVNRTGMLYPTKDEENSSRCKKDLFQLMKFMHEYSGTTPEKPKILARSVKRVAFTLLAPNSVQINITVANEKEEYQFLTETGLMNFGTSQ